MSNPAFWITDPDSGEERLVYYNELDQEVLQKLVGKPIGGFIFPADTFMLAKLSEVPFYVKDWLPKMGKSLLYAPPKTGKSYLCLQLARCIGSEEEFLGIPTKKGRVLYIQFELGEEVLQSRLLQTGKSYDNVFVGTTFSMKLDSKVGQERLWDALNAVEPNVLILDPKIKFISGDENESQDMRVVCDWLDNVIEGFKCSIFIVDHSGKDLSKGNRGSSVWEGWVDSYLQMNKISKKGEPLKVRIQPMSLRHAALPPESIEAVLNKDFEFELVGSALTVKQRILDFIQKAKEPVSPAQIFDAKIGSNTSVYEKLKELIEEGKIKKERWGKYK